MPFFLCAFARRLFAKLKTDSQIQTLLTRNAISGQPLPEAVSMSKLLASTAADASEAVSSSPISWSEFDAAVKAGVE